MPRETEPQYFTDVIKGIDLSHHDRIVITTAGGSLTLTPSGFQLTGPAEAMEELSTAANQFFNHELQLKLDPEQGCLELIACRGRGRSYHHALGGLPSDWIDGLSRSTLLNANARLAAWHRRRTM